MASCSVLLPFGPTRPHEVLPFAALTMWSKANRMWQGQAGVSDPHLPFTFAAGAGFPVPAGIGVTLMPYRHPYQAALQAQSLALSTGHTVLVGYGPGAVGLQQNMLGAPYRSQLGAVREYVDIVRDLLTGDEVRRDGDYYRCHGSLLAVPSPAVEVGVGVLRSGMARLAGEIADVAITWMTPASYIREVLLPALREGAERRGRPTPRVVAMVPVAMRKPGRDPVELVLASNAAHLRAPHYVDMLARSGIAVDMSDPKSSASALLSGGGFVFGDETDVRDGLRHFEKSGVDEIVLNVTGVHRKYGSAAAVAELEFLVDGVWDA